MFISNIVSKAGIGKGQSFGLKLLKGWERDSFNSGKLIELIFVVIF
jgi:hypothetical protein